MMRQIGRGALLLASLLAGTARAADESSYDEMYAAVQAQDKARVEALIAKGSDVNVKNSKGWTPLHAAALFGLTDVLKLLIAKGADVKAKDDSGETPLLEAANADIAALLIAGGADVNAKGNNGQTPLHEAVRLYSIREGLAELLVAKGANVNARDKYGRTPLLVTDVSASYAYAGAVEVLIAKGADVNAQDKDGNTLLHVAVSKASDGLVELLIAKGADVNIKNGKGETPLGQLTAQLREAPGDEALREKFINLARTMDPPPTLPEGAGRRMARGFTAFKEAKSVSDYKDAVVEFEQATLAAPWYADAYYNLGQARAKVEDYAGACASLKLYLLAAPGAKDAAEAKTLMYEMEYKQEKADKERSAAQAKQQQLAQTQRLMETFRGTWYSAECGTAAKSFFASITKGCTAAQFDGPNWMSGARGQGPAESQFEVGNDGTVKIVPTVTSLLAGCEGGFVFGIPQGASFSDIRWEFRPSDGPPRQIWSRMGNDGNRLWVSCKRPLFGEDPNVAYGYVFWSRTPL